MPSQSEQNADSRNPDSITSKSSGLEYIKANLDPRPSDNSRATVTKNDKEVSGDDAS